MLRSIYKRLWPFAKPHRWAILVAAILSAVANLLNGLVITVILPVVSIILGEATSMTSAAPKSSFIDFKGLLHSFTNFFVSGSRYDSLIRICGFILLIFLLKNLLGFVSSYIMAVVEGRMVKSIRDRVFEKLSSLSLDYYFERKTGQLISRITGDVGTVNSTLVNSLTTIVGQPLQILFFLAVLFGINTELALISFAIGLGSMLLINLFGKGIKTSSHKVSMNMGDVLASAQEMISGIKVVKSFGMEQYEVERFKRETRAHYNGSRRLSRIRGLIGPVNEILAVVGFIGILYFGGTAVIEGTMKGSELLLFLVSLIVLMQPVRVLSEVNGRLHEGAAAAEHIFQIFDAEPTVKSGTAPVSLQISSPIILEDVEFRYPRSEVNAVDNLSFEIFPNEVIALVGPSGGGKTTLVDLLVRFYDPTSGSISMNGRNIRDYDLSEFRKLFGIVTQDTVLFHDTVFNNIAYGNPAASYESVVEAAMAANAHDFIQAMPSRYETIVGDRGVRLSGGQRQRIAIARALLKNPPVLIFDEATSALDTENEMLVQQAIERLLSSRTAVVIAHRLSTIQQADRIIVIDKGRILESGTHQSLLQNPEGMYQKLYRIQQRAASESIVGLEM